MLARCQSQDCLERGFAGDVVEYDALVLLVGHPYDRICASALSTVIGWTNYTNYTEILKVACALA
jgi:hypothetical protein